MTIEEAQAAVERIRGIADVEHDDEGAHCAEEDLWEAVLRQIANRSRDPLSADLARIALGTKSIGFCRW